MRTLTITLLLLTAGIAGCLGDDSGPDDEPGGEALPTDATWAEKAVPHGDGHDHADRGQHTDLSTLNFEVVGWTPAETEHHGATSGDYLCGGIATEGERDLAVVHSFGTDVAFVVVDVTDRANPEKIGEFVLENTHTYDVDVTPDGAYVTLATSPLDTGPDEGPADQAETALAPSPGDRELRSVDWRFETACGTQQQGTELLPLASGVVLVDLTDPTSPQFADYEPEPPVGAHSVFTTEVDGTYWVLGSNTNLVHQTSFFHFYTIEELPTGAQLVEQAAYSAQNPDAGSEVPLTNGHVDGWIQEHPETGETLAYLANWNGGLHIVRIDGPGQLTRLAVWNDYDPDAGAGMTGVIHEALPMDTLWDGDTHYTFIGQEVGSRPAERPTGQIVMLDTTDPASPEPVARWTLPVDVEFGASLQFSTHYIEVDETTRTLFVTLYHGGMWAVDADPGQGPELPTLGVFIPDKAPPSPPPDHLAIFRWTPIVMDVHQLPTGELVVWDGTSGTYTVSFDSDLPVPTPEPWTQDAWIDG